jgi:signal recognition particle subunit SRP14
VCVPLMTVTYQSGLDGDAMDTSDSAPSSSHSCVVKATDGKASLTTHIAPSLLPPFAERYNALLRAAFAPHLRKRDKKKEKARAEEVVKRKKELEAVVDRTLSNAGKRGSAGRSSESFQSANDRRGGLAERETQAEGLRPLRRSLADPSCCATLLPPCPLPERQRQLKSLKKAEAELGRIEKREERKKTAASTGEGAAPAIEPSS